MPVEQPMRTGPLAVLAVLLLALSVPGAGRAKGYSRVVLLGSDGRWTETRANDRDLDQWVDWSVKPRAAHGGHLRLFFVGPGDFPANPARYYPRGGCVALDWPTYETSCHPLQRPVGRLFRQAQHLPRFTARPTVPIRITYLGRFTGLLKTAAALAGPLELSLDRQGHPAPMPGSCYGFRAVWKGPAAARRPRMFRLCPGGIYARGRLYPLRRGVWAWFDLNV
jgi:hypothetical protein